MKIEIKIAGKVYSPVADIPKRDIGDAFDLRETAGDILKAIINSIGEPFEDPIFLCPFVKFPMIVNICKRKAESINGSISYSVPVITISGILKTDRLFVIEPPERIDYIYPKFYMHVALMYEHIYLLEAAEGDWEQPKFEDSIFPFSVPQLTEGSCLFKLRQNN